VHLLLDTAEIRGLEWAAAAAAAYLVHGKPVIQTELD
jgi:hypothetical protein